MIDASHFTVEQLQGLLEEGERWLELSAGRLIRHDPPDVVHGNVVRNVSRALAAQFRQRPDLVACFELGLITGRNPDTVLFPAISCFSLPGGFEESDKLLTDSIPRLVIEIASTNDRRAHVVDRVKSHLRRGVASIWVFDPVDQEVHQFRQDESARRFRTEELLRDTIVVPGFELRVSEVFMDPEWWSAKPNPS